MYSNSICMVWLHTMLYLVPLILLLFCIAFIRSIIYWLTLFCKTIIVDSLYCTIVSILAHAYRLSIVNPPSLLFGSLQLASCRQKKICQCLKEVVAQQKTHISLPRGCGFKSCWVMYTFLFFLSLDTCPQLGSFLDALLVWFSSKRHIWLYTLTGSKPNRHLSSSGIICFFAILIRFVTETLWKLKNSTVATISESDSFKVIFSQ